MKRIMCLAIAVIMLLGLVACGNNGGSKESSDGTPIIRWIASDPGHPGRDEVEKEVVRYVKEKINVELDIIWYPAENLSILGTTIVADEWDVANVDGNLFNGNVSRNAFLALDDYIDTYLPTPKAILPEENFQACSWQGKIYGLTSYKDFSEGWGMLYNKDLFEEFNIALPEDYNTEMDLVPLFYELTEAYQKANPGNEKCVVRASAYLNSWFQYDGLCGSWSSPLVVTNIEGTDGFDDIDPQTAFSPYFTDSYLAYVKAIWQMAQDNIIPSAPGDGDMDWSGGAGFLQTSCGWIEVADNQFSDAWDCGWHPAKTAIKTTATMQPHINVVSSNTENPEAALKFLEMLYSDEYLCTTLKFGVKDRDWADEDNDGVVELLDRNADGGNRFWYDWYGTRNSSALGGKIAEGFSADFPEKLEALNNSGIASAHAGFVFDVSPVANEIAACNNVLAQYAGMLQYPSFADPNSFIEEFRGALKANGIDKIVAEAQAQLDAWHAAQ